MAAFGLPLRQFWQGLSCLSLSEPTERCGFSALQFFAGTTCPFDCSYRMPIPAHVVA
ncbi:hypothetical protein DAEQUDRAFT_723761 [Daedalea quercina L-15889]|uniref:Uncharacterized protein n=1 Tax=Daedalea quercina L-15889 TaxID=1314783 RepID=A0A165S962_9APHY|nr:hypothetical protein DAEQUDRAFT_723761 [Daedalea quercina L-15889]